MAAERAAQGVAAPMGPAVRLDSVRHVFTHRIWEMQLYHIPVQGCAPAADGLWASAEQIRALPMPAAMHAPRKAALGILEDASKQDGLPGSGASSGS